MFKMAKEVEKFWGKEIWMANTDLYCGKKLILEKGKRCSMHYHERKDETFYVDSGKVLLEYNVGEIFDEIILMQGDSKRIYPLQWHRFSGLENSVIIEISTHHEDLDSYRDTFSEDIPQKIKDKYNLN